MRTVATAILVFNLLVIVGSGKESNSPAEKGVSSKPRVVGLHMAALQGNIEAIRQHIEAGSNLNEKDAYGSTPLIIATTFGKTEVALALIDAGADLKIRSNDGSTPLHVAAFLCRTGIVKALLDNSADKYLRNNAGNTAFESVAGSFEDVKGIYENIEKALGPLGLKLDYEEIRRTRPEIAEMLRPRTGELEAVVYAPLARNDWKISTPAEQGLDPMLVSDLYLEAIGLPTLYGLLIIKNGYLIAESYFNEGSVEQKSNRQSVTKSFTSALAGIALDQGILSSVDLKMMEFFPEFADQIKDPRKRQITIRELLEMRSGYPWEERKPPYMEVLFVSGDWHWRRHIVDVPLTSDPGTEFSYSNLTSHFLGVIVARACGSDLESYARKNLFRPINAEIGEWYCDADKFNFGSMGIFVTARDMGKFGLLYLNHGQCEGNQVLSAAWVRDSLQRYSENINFTGTGNNSSEVGRYFRDIGYGYQWWSARAGDHRFDFAWGHGGNLIILLEDLDMIIVTTANPLEEMQWNEGWKYEGAIINLVGKFIESLPKGKGASESEAPEG
jgi:CubicO group peptidase (beta-lactamase class C family)